MKPIKGEHPYMFVEGVYAEGQMGWRDVECVHACIRRNESSSGYSEIFGGAERIRKDRELRRNFLRYLEERGLAGVRLVISDKASGLVDALGDFYPAAKWQRCVVHWYRNAFGKCPARHARAVATC